MKSDLSSSYTRRVCHKSYETLDTSQPDQLSAEVNQFVHDLYGDMSKSDLGTFLGLLCEDAVPSLVSLERALAAHDYPTAAEKAHKLRNTTGAVGATDLNAYLAALEDQLKSGTLKVEGSEVRRLREGCEQVFQALGSIRERLSD